MQVTKIDALENTIVVQKNNIDNMNDSYRFILKQNNIKIDDCVDVY
jgi:hypothetical protein